MLFAKDDLTSDGCALTNWSTCEDSGVDLCFFLQTAVHGSNGRLVRRHGPGRSAKYHHFLIIFFEDGRLQIGGRRNSSIILSKELLACENRWVTAHLPASERRVDELTPRGASSRCEEVLKLAGIEGRRTGAKLAC